jgi:hypothetical protein
LVEQRGNVDEKAGVSPRRIDFTSIQSSPLVLVPPSEVDVGRFASVELPRGIGCACIEKLNLPFDAGAVYVYISPSG